MSFRKIARKVKAAIVRREPTSAFSKFMIVNMYKAALVIMGRYGRRKQSIVDMIVENLPEEQKNDSRIIRKLFREIVYCRFMYGISAKEYFVFEFEKLSHEGRKTYLTRGNKYKFYRQFNDPNYTGFFNEKTETFRKFGKFYNRDVLCMYDEDDYQAFLDFIAKHERFIYKPADDYGGHGIEIYNAADFSSKEDLFTIIMSGGSCVVEELIVQADEIARFHPASVNTVRVVAFHSPAGNTEIQWCFLRMGMGGSHTDNMSSGGLAAMIDPKTGIIYTTGRDWLGEIHMCHPDTGVQLVGYQMPEWDKLMELLHEIVTVVPQVRLVGWDFAYSDKGWVFVEGNSRPQCVSAQITEFNGKLHLYENMYNMFVEETEGEAGSLESGYDD